MYSLLTNLVSIIDASFHRIYGLYLHASAITAQTYKTPLMLKKQFHLSEEESLRLLNQDEDNVMLLKDLITILKLI